MGLSHCIPLGFGLFLFVLIFKLLFCFVSLRPALASLTPKVSVAAAAGSPGAPYHINPLRYFGYWAPFSAPLCSPRSTEAEHWDPPPWAFLPLLQRDVGTLGCWKQPEASTQVPWGAAPGGTSLVSWVSLLSSPVAVGKPFPPGHLQTRVSISALAQLCHLTEETVVPQLTAQQRQGWAAARLGPGEEEKVALIFVLISSSLESFKLCRHDRFYLKKQTNKKKGLKKNNKQNIQQQNKANKKLL